MRLNSKTKYFASPIGASLFLLFCVNFVITINVFRYFAAKRRIWSLFWDKMAKRHKSAIIRSRYICGREHETSSMHPYVNLSFRNDNHIVVNPSFSNFKYSIIYKGKVRWSLGKCRPTVQKICALGTNSFFFFRKLDQRYKLPEVFHFLTYRAYSALNVFKRILFFVKKN